MLIFKLTIWDCQVWIEELCNGFVLCSCSSFSCGCVVIQVVASLDWPKVTNYAGRVSTQAHRQELIQDLYKTWNDPSRGPVTGGMIK